MKEEARPLMRTPRIRYGILQFHFHKDEKKFFRIPEKKKIAELQPCHNNERVESALKECGYNSQLERARS